MNDVDTRLATYSAAQQKAAQTLSPSPPLPLLHHSPYNRPGTAGRRVTNSARGAGDGAAPTVIMVTAPDAYNMAMAQMVNGNAPETELFELSQRNVSLAGQSSAPARQPQRRVEEFDDLPRGGRKDSRDREAREDLLVRREQERSKAEVEALLSGQKRFVTAMQEEHKCEREANEAREKEHKEERRSARMEIADLKEELKAERKAHLATRENAQQQTQAMAAREQQLMVEVSELRANFQRERDQSQSLKAESTRLRTTMTALEESVNEAPTAGWPLIRDRHRDGTFRHADRDAAFDNNQFEDEYELAAAAPGAAEPVQADTDHELGHIEVVSPTPSALRGASRSGSVAATPSRTRGRSTSVESSRYPNHPGQGRLTVPNEDGVWLLLRVLMESDKAAGIPLGVAADHPQTSREEAARKLITNHAYVLKDLCNPSKVRNIHGTKLLTQLDLERVPVESSPHVDAFLREVAWRLLGGAYELNTHLDPTNPKQCQAWKAAAQYLEKRLQTSAEQVPGRPRDMAPAAAKAMVAVMMEIAQVEPAWAPLQVLLENGAAGPVEGAALAHSQAVRHEAAHKLVINHAYLVKDVCNSSSVSNIHGNMSLTQVDLNRLPYEDTPHVDSLFREVARRLLGGSAELEVKVDQANPRMIMAWKQAALYTEKRLQTTAGQMPGRTADMSPLAASAMVEVMAEVAAGQHAWRPLQQLLDDGTGAVGLMGAATEHSKEARLEAARKCISNHMHIVKDVCNPSVTTNIHGNKSLTQQELERVPVDSSQFVDQFLREVAGRLLGGAETYERRLDLHDPQQAMAWVQAAAYLEKRLQSSAEQMPGRPKDMDPAAAAAMVAVMTEIAQSALAWLTLWQMLGPASSSEGRSQSDASAAQIEAARKLITNHGAVRLDICNPFGTQSIKGNKLTQARSLMRLPHEDTPYVDQFLREIARRLLGPRAASLRSAVHLDPKLPAQARAWEGAARMFSQRIQSTPQQSPGRNPDMSPEAAEAMKAVIEELSGMAITMLADMTARGIDVSRVIAAPLPQAAPDRPMSGTAIQTTTMAMRHLTHGKDAAFNKWLGSKASAALLDSWNEMLLDSLQSPEAFQACAARHFGVYNMPADMQGWLLGMCVLAESLPLAFCLSDAQTAGFPLIFINKKFTDVTGYTKDEAHGRNCRFLQGPSTNPVHGKQLLDTLRAGQDSQIMLVNYRKNGEVFENLLTMAYIRDAHGRRRYCVGLQLDLTGLASDDGPWGLTALASPEGKQLIEETRKKYTMLIKLLPQTLPVPTPQQPISNRAAPPQSQSGSWSCPQLGRLADTLDAAMPSTVDKNWISVLYTLFDSTPHAVTVCDMGMPGLPLDYCNQGFANLTGYPCDEVMGKNCRFLQDEKTEPRALYDLITGIRTYTPIHVKITNVRKDGVRFVNDITTHPIFDATGKCLYMIAILADAAKAATDAPTLTPLREVLPKSPVDPSLLPRTSPRFEPVPPIEQWKEFQKANTKLIRLLWATEPDGALRQLISMHPAMATTAIRSFGQWLQTNNRADDEAIFAKLLEQQRSGAWVPLAGRVAIPQ